VNRRVQLLVALLGASLGGSAACAEDALRICMDENLPPYSIAHGSTGSGFDVALGEALAARLGRGLAIQWFESKIDEESSPTLEANALLSDGRCDLVAGYPLVVNALGQPRVASARLPGFRGAVGADRRRRVTLGSLVPSHPYQRSPQTLLLAASVAPRSIAGLGDIADLRFGVEGGTFADAILMFYNNGQLVSHITHYPPGSGQAFAKLESGEIDATFVTLHRFDLYKQTHPGTKVRSSGFNFPVAFNLGYVALSSHLALIEEVDAALDQLQASGEIAAIAAAAGVTYVTPSEPAISPEVTFAQLGR
jgi:ABC-type amino acid transport substrate-binding protein